MATRNFVKKVEPNFGNLKICLIDCLTVDSEFHEILADRWLKPMRNPRARELVAPMLCLPEHGGMIISVRDWLGGEERMGCPLSIEEDDQDEDSDDEATSAVHGMNGFTSLLDGIQRRTFYAHHTLSEKSGSTRQVFLVAFGHYQNTRRTSSTPDRSSLSQTLLRQ